MDMQTQHRKPSFKFGTPVTIEERCINEYGTLVVERGTPGVVIGSMKPHTDRVLVATRNTNKEKVKVTVPYYALEVRVVPPPSMQV